MDFVKFSPKAFFFQIYDFITLVIKISQGKFDNPIISKPVLTSF